MSFGVNLTEYDKNTFMKENPIHIIMKAPLYNLFNLKFSKKYVKQQKVTHVYFDYFAFSISNEFLTSSTKLWIIAII